MSLVPRTHAEKIQYFQNHAQRWAEVAEQIGSTPEQIATLQDSVDAARASLKEQQLAQQAAQAATIKLHDDLARMDLEGKGAIARARAKARVSGDHSIYALAWIPAPATPSTLAEPGTPRDFKVNLQEGSLEITWKCDQPKGASGTIYEIYRSDSGPGGRFNYLGNTGIRKFMDATIPAGASLITYKLRAVRSTKVGWSATFNVQFAGNGSGPGEPVVPHAPRIAA